MGSVTWLEHHYFPTHFVMPNNNGGKHPHIVGLNPSIPLAPETPLKIFPPPIIAISVPVFESPLSHMRIRLA